MSANDYIIRLEEQKDHREVETLVREAFWNLYRPGATEHYVVHVLRTDPAFVSDLDYVLVKDGRIVGQNVFVRAQVATDDGGTVDVLTMGPISVAPDLAHQGYGRALLDYTLGRASELGFGAVLIEGDIAFYGKSGFRLASEFGIRYHGLPADADASFFLCRELSKGYLEGITGVYQTPAGYLVDEGDVDEFDRGFPAKERLRLPGQLF